MDENVCRICLQVSEEEEMTSIFESDANNTIISNKIKSCCGVELPIESDGFPTKICSKCKIFLTIAYKLRTICQNSDAYLRRFKAKDSEENDENEEMQLKRETEDFAEYIDDIDEMSVKSYGSPFVPLTDSNEINIGIEIERKPSLKKQEKEQKPPTKHEDSDGNETDSHNHACDECGKIYSRKTNLEKHIQLHRELAVGIRKPPEKFGVCPHCGDTFPQKSLPVHIRRHTGEKPFGCDECEMRYVRRQDLIVHKRCHTGEKPHVCLTCGKAFSRANQLVRHIRVHTGERPYKCTQCDRGFAQRNDLNLHIRRHTGEKPYQCGVCGESFINGTTLKNHRKITDHYEEDRRDRFEKIRVTNPRRVYRATPLPKQPQGPVLILEQVEPEL